LDFIWLCSLRRNLNLWQKAEQAKKKEALEAEKAKARQIRKPAGFVPANSQEQAGDTQLRACPSKHREGLLDTSTISIIDKDQG